MISELYDIKRINYQLAAYMVKHYHYLHRVPPISEAFGLFDCGKIIGVITYGIPQSHTLRKGICGDSEYDNVIELTRLWVKDATPKNTESYFIANTMKELSYEIIVSFADDSVGHIGIVYQATNFIYTGLSAPFTDPKVQGLEGQHHATFAHGMTNTQVREKFGYRVQFVNRAPKHRYVYFNAKRKRRAELVAKLRYPIMPYPISKEQRLVQLEKYLTSE